MSRDLPLQPLPIDDGVARRRRSACANRPRSCSARRRARARRPAFRRHLLAGGLADRGKIVVLQPRRVAARATAARIAAERGWRLGDEVGYQVRFENRGPARGRGSRSSPKAFCCGGCWTIRFCRTWRSSSSTSSTSGRWPATWPWRWSGRCSSRCGRSCGSWSCRPRSPPSRSLAYLGGCPIVESQGRTFPVEVRYQATLDRRPLASWPKASSRVLDRHGGDCLVFLPGVGEIRQCENGWHRWPSAQDLALLQLYGDLPAEQQDAVLRPASRRKVILATNVAETSLTIEGVTGVVDSGLARVLRLRRADRPRSAGAVADLEGLRRSASRPGGTHAAGRLPAAVAGGGAANSPGLRAARDSAGRSGRRRAAGAVLDRAGPGGVSLVRAAVRAALDRACPALLVSWARPAPRRSRRSAGKSLRCPSIRGSAGC